MFSKLYITFVALSKYPDFASGNGTLAISEENFLANKCQFVPIDFSANNSQTILLNKSLYGCTNNIGRWWARLNGDFAGA
jgi:hypothetical protein